MHYVPEDEIRGPLVSIPFSAADTAAGATTSGSAGQSWQDEGFIVCRIQVGTMAGGASATAGLQFSEDGITWVPMETMFGLAADSKSVTFDDTESDVVKQIHVDTQMIPQSYGWVRVAFSAVGSPISRGAWLEFHGLKNVKGENDRTLADATVYLDGNTAVADGVYPIEVIQ